nr:hypothetical protein [Tanacetum cinerariifolium]
MHGPYVRRIIPEPRDLDREVPVAKIFHEQTDEELTKKENWKGNVGAAQDEGNGNGNNGNQRRDLDEIKEVNANCILMANLQQASTSVPSVEQSGGIVEQHPATFEETRAYIDSLYNNLAIELRAQLFGKVSDQKDTTQGTSANAKFSKKLILGKPPSSSKSKLYFVTPFPNSKVIPKVAAAALAVPAAMVAAMMGLTVVAVVDMVATAVGVSGVSGGVFMEMWRCMASVGGGLDRSGDWKYFWVRRKISSEKLSCGGDRRLVAGSGGGGQRQRWPAVEGR